MFLGENPIVSRENPMVSRKKPLQNAGFSVAMFDDRYPTCVYLCLDFQ